MASEIITTSDLAIFKEELLSDLKAFFTEEAKFRLHSKRVLKSKDVRELLKISAGALQNLRINRTLPFKKVGGTIYYDYQDVIKLLKPDSHDR